MTSEFLEWLERCRVDFTKEAASLEKQSERHLGAIDFILMIQDFIKSQNKEERGATSELSDVVASESAEAAD